jgi:hypothetical protein
MLTPVSTSREGRWRRWSTALALAVVAWLSAARPVEAAIVKSVTSGSTTLAASSTTKNVALTGVDITKAFVSCAAEPPDRETAYSNATCDLNNNGAGGAAQLTVTVGASLNNPLPVRYYVVEFTAGVSVQRGTASFTSTNLSPSATPSLTAVDCTKSFVVISTRSTDVNTTADEAATIRAILGTGASPCTSGTTTSLELRRNEGVSGVTVTVIWQVVTMEGASVQRGTSCIGGASTCTTNSGGTAGLNNRITLGTAVDTTKSFILMTKKGGPSIGGVEGEYNTRAEFLATGASVTGVQFVRALGVTANNHQVDIGYEVVSLSDGSTVQTSGTTPTAMSGTSATTNINTIDTTRTAAFYTTSGGDSGGTDRTPSTYVVVSMNGANGSGASSLSFARQDNSVTSTTAWFAVSFFRCATASGTTYDTLCTVGASTTGTAATVNWSSLNTVVVARSTSSISASPTNGTSYSVGNTLAAGVTVVYSGSNASDTSYADSGLTTGTTYFYKVWAKGGTAGSCTASPCYVAGAQASITPRAAPTTWSSIVVGGAALNPAVAGIGTSRMALGSNNDKLIALASGTGAWASVPAATVGAVSGYVSVFGSTEMMVGGDGNGWVYSINPATGAYNWLVKLNADAFQAAVTTYLRQYFSSQMTTAYPGSYDVIFVATNNTLLTNNKVFALRSDTGATLWTFDPANLNSSPCVGGCPMDQIVGQPFVDYLNDRLYVASGPGSLSNQNSLWFLDLRNSGAITTVFAGGADYVTAPSQSFQGDRLYVGDASGTLHIANLSALTQTLNTAASGTGFKGFVWEDFGIEGRVYFVTTDGNVWCLDTLSNPSNSTPCWKTKPVSAGTVSQMMISDLYAWAGGSDGTLYQLNLTSGIVVKTLVVGDGTLALGPISTETGNELYVTTSDGKLYKIALTNGSLP